MDLRDSPGVRSSNPSNYGYLYSAEREAPPPEVGWTDKPKDEPQGPVNLYSENVVQESNTTESVDRESIANLNTTRRQWENIFSSHQTVQNVPVKKKTPSKWEVKLPHSEKHPAVPPVNSSTNVESGNDNNTDFYRQDSDSSSKPAVDMESAIEREIRLAHEREEMLRAEKEERQRRLAQEKEKTSQGQNITSSYVTANAESDAYQPAYEELAEADRGSSDLWTLESHDQSRVAVSYETSGYQETGSQDDDDDYNDNDNSATESIIEREIRLQNEREAELRKQRLQQAPNNNNNNSNNTNISPAGVHGPSQIISPAESASSLASAGAVGVSSPDQGYTVRDSVETSASPDYINDSPPPEEMNAHMGGEDLIARELRELREREEEVKRMRSAFQTQKLEDETDSGVVNSSAPKDSVRISPPRGHSPRNSLESNSLHLTSSKSSYEAIPSARDVKVHPFADNDDDDDDNNNRSTPFKTTETPIEREMRLSRERENELRRSKGLPELIDKDDDYYGNSSNNQDSAHSDNVVTKPRRISQPNTSMRKFASNRLEKEVEQQKERERTLRSEGKITSSGDQQEHIQPRKYMEVTGVSQADHAAVRNFVTSRRISTPAPPTPDREPSEAGPSPGGAGGSSSGKKGGPAGSTGGRLFTYKEFKQTAESKIEKELREMREREEELRMQRSAETPRQ